MKKLRFGLPALVVAASLLAGCGALDVLPGVSSYYRVTDTATGAVYYTDGIKKERRGVVEFRDANTRAWVSLPAAEVVEISKGEFRAYVTQ